MSSKPLPLPCTAAARPKIGETQVSSRYWRKAFDRKVQFESGAQRREVRGEPTRAARGNGCAEIRREESRITEDGARDGVTEELMESLEMGDRDEHTTRAPQSLLENKIKQGS